MGYSIKETRTDVDFLAHLKNRKIPILVLDQKWHHLFAGIGKPDSVQALEKKVGELLARQGRLNQDFKEYKKLKSTLMKNIVENMDGAEEGENHASSKKLSEDRRLIDEINQKIEDCEDELLEVPKQIKEANDALMQETVAFFYQKLRVNTRDIEEISEWIKNIRIELKKQIIRKQNAEVKNKEIYSYMHDIFGPQVVDVFDLKYESEEEEA